MALITLLDAQLAFGHVALLDHADFSLETNQRIGLIGRNGTGKSSLLKILAGLEKPDDGTLQLQQNLRIAYVPQEPSLDPHATVFIAASAGLARTRHVVEMYLAADEHTDLDALQSEIEALDGWNWEQRVEVCVFVGRQIHLHHVPRPCQSCASSYKNSSMRVETRFLRYVGNAQVLLQLQGAVVGFIQARQYFEQRRFAGAVAADQTNALVGFK